tara:strand:- start:536 stop:886 length:351 start_codon:yes stop_codon:yes gene_type:complete
VKISNYHQVLLIIITLFVVHIVEIGLYATCYDVSTNYFKIGSLHGKNINSLMEYMYYSTVIYTSLGLGDVYPIGHLRFITGIEALNGLMLITWSASFTFLVMKRLWPWSDTCSDKK